MSYPDRETLALTTATSGDVTAFTSVFHGHIDAIIYTKATGTPMASTTDITVTTEDSGLTIWAGANLNATTVVYPVNAAVLTDNSASTKTERPIPVAGERVKVVVAQGGDTKTGTVQVIWS